ncbi:hypothetical protein POTOM_006785 [Populus tomentosa]|uniref:Uncharacterized protein n=1 Tax=Populus tomentosa TaxID=118781 RepID=A0A8X8DFE4_POPTO|nr:hypothetical protein POTOM_006785 [Populus tomentosa]
MMEGVWSMPFTSYNRSLQASAMIRDMGKDLIGHDTSSILVTFLIRLLANEPSIYAAILNDHEQITMNKHKGQLLTWEDLAKMSYTWRIAEDLRIFPPVFGCFRQAVKDKEYNGYLIP